MTDSRDSEKENSASERASERASDMSHVTQNQPDKCHDFRHAKETSKELSLAARLNLTPSHWVVVGSARVRRGETKSFCCSDLPPLHDYTVYF